MKRLLGILLLCLPALGQATYKGGKYSGTGNYNTQGQGVVGAGENFYCPAGTGELTEGTPTWGAADGVAQLPTRCINTAVASTPGGTHIGGGAATTYTPADTAGLNSALGTLQCGDTIVLTAGNSYTGTFTIPALSCDGGHWITVKSSGVSNSNFPAEGMRATPCLAGISNDATNGRNNPGYPDYACPSYPTVLSAQIVTATANQPAMTFAAGANHYRFIGIELTKVAEVKLNESLARLALDQQTQGANHIIFDRSVIHGQPWTLAATTNSETNNGIKANDAQWVAVVNSWIYDTYCVAACVDSHSFSGGNGLYGQGPYKLYNNFMATAGETWLFGGGGQGALNPLAHDFEARQNHSFKNLLWMIPISTCSTYNAVIPKNLGEFKNMTYALVEGNVFENSWQGCQSDQVGWAILLNPANQSTHNSVTVTFDGTAVVTTTGAGNFSHYGSPGDPGCFAGGCIMQISDNSRSDNGTQYRFCQDDGSNGCYQTSDGTQNGTPLNETTQARLTSAPPSGSAVSATACAPGDCPQCKVQHIVYRYNEIYNTTNGFQVNTGHDATCRDESSGMAKVIIRDNLLHGLSREMGNGVSSYQQSSALSMGSGTESTTTGFVEISHNTVAIETGNSGGFGGLGDQVDHTDHQYLQGFNLHDNVSPAPWLVSHGGGSVVTKGVNDLSGLANTYQTDACRPYQPNDSNNDIAGGYAVNAVAAGMAFTFSPSLASYLVTVNGTNAATTTTTSSSFTLTPALSVGDAITVRDLNTCAWTFQGNLLGTGLPGSAKAYDPYPASNNTNCGVSGTASCILDGVAFTGLFFNWGTGRTGNFGLTSATYLNSASDANARAATGKSPGADLTVLTQLTQGVRGTVFYPALTITTTSLPGATVGTAYQASLQASAGASPYKGWWVETDPTQCGGNCGAFPASAGIIMGRGGVVNGPFIVGTVSRASNVSTFNVQQTIVAGTWQVNQAIVLSGFVNGTGTQANDGSFNGTCVISAVNGNSFSCPQTGVDVTSHSPKNASLITFAPVSSGSFSFWVGARDGAFQVARGAVTVTVQ